MAFPPRTDTCTVSISFCVALLAILLAFNRQIRALFPFNSIVYSPIVYISTVFIVHVPLPRFSIYLLWLRLTRFSREVTEKIDEAAEGMKAKIMQEEWKQRSSRKEIERQSKARKEAKSVKKAEDLLKQSNMRGGNKLRHRWRRGAVGQENGNAELGLGRGRQAR